MPEIRSESEDIALIDMQATTIAFIGLGNMGAPMAQRLLEAGHRVIGYDTSADALRVLSEEGGVAASSAASAASDADVTVLMLPNSEVVEAVLDSGLAAALKPGSILMDMGSSEPLRTRALATKLSRERSVELVDAPVSGGVKGAVAGTLTIMVGGREYSVARVTPILERLGRPVAVGDVGAGHALKALNNLLSATHLLVSSEALHVGARFGLDPEIMLDVINASSGRSGSTQSKWPDFVLPQTYDSGFALMLMLKDMRIATGLARQMGLPSLLGEEAVAQWARASEALGPSADHTEIARWIPDESSRRL
ncbi:2-(hydroxymethyl)glutarate dehydrogenase [Rhodococcus ruber]|uniref:NAD(P)-dependent oxidoreductase n=1 Tax=Rhodococcus ruber TaxID=1830 RepID=UPI00315CBFA3